MASTIEIFIENGEVLESSVNINGEITTLSDLSVEQIGQLESAITGLQANDSSNKGWLLNGIEMDGYASFILKHPSISNETTMYDKGSMVSAELFPDIYSPLELLLNSVINN